MDWNGFSAVLQSQGMRLFGGLMVLVVGFILTHWIMRFANGRLKKSRIDPTLRGFVANILRLLMHLAVILTAVSVMGIPLTSVLTIVASAGVAVSLAMQGALSNVVGGVTLLLLKPIKAGDYVRISDYEGTVQTIGAFYTEMNTFDNRHISIPNSSITNTAIINYTREGTRRLDITYSVSYQSDTGVVFRTLKELTARCPGVLRDPLPEVHLKEFGSGSLNFVVRVWMKTADYWNVNFYLLEEGKKALDAAGIEIPYPQLDVHIK